MLPHRLLERLLGHQSAEVAESCASNLEEMCRACKRLDASLILKSLCMFPAGKALLGRVEERVCQLRKILQEHSTIEGVFPRAVAAFEKDFSRAMTRSKVGKMARAALTIASTQLPPWTSSSWLGASQQGGPFCSSPPLAERS